jgi:hypothetical protein
MSHSRSTLSDEAIKAAADKRKAALELLFIRKFKELILELSPPDPADLALKIDKKVIVKRAAIKALEDY